MRSMMCALLATVCLAACVAFPLEAAAAGRGRSNGNRNGNAKVTRITVNRLGVSKSITKIRR